MICHSSCSFFSEVEIARLNAEHERIEAKIAEQGFSVEEVQQMHSDRDKLKATLEDLKPQSAEAARATGELEIAFGRRADIVDQVLTRYTSLLYDTELLPTAPEPFSHINFKLDLNTAVSNPADMLKGDDLKKIIHPALSQIAEMKSEERASLENEKIQADEDLDSLTQRCHKMEEDAEPKENQLLVLSKKIEELRMTVAGETAAANAESAKLEQELGSMETESKQSAIALTIRKQRLEVEFKDIVRKTEQLKQETIQKITTECDQMLNAKLDVTKELESLVLYARDN
ncbi:kinetochore-associated Ndc80 complex subunit ndc80 [Tulasnella sp. JGI-2019a]|nr:kinetochore-associated Ndc80 complex subunit ndc80 [Tulasnella sp. JGI-2019a]KAG9007089.1 kinetochore-associated Ndc80 complex subunit ndc80 [Tulasnella sp. JGI-2019a]